MVHQKSKHFRQLAVYIPAAAQANFKTRTFFDAAAEYLTL
jgi:hypothetical protein